MVENESLNVTLYTSNDCSPCEMMKHKLNVIKEQLPLKLTTINISTSTNIPDGIRVTPVLKIASNGERIVGNVDMDDLRNIFLRNLFSRV